LLFNALTERLRKKKWLDEDFDGNKTIIPEIEAAITLCATADRFWVIQSHHKRKTVTHSVYTIYNTGGAFLILKQVNSDTYQGQLLSDSSVINRKVFGEIPLCGTHHTYQKISIPDLVTVTENEPFSLINASLYTTEVEGDTKLLICLEALMFLILDNHGLYELSISCNREGEFLPLSSTTGQTEFERIFDLREGF